MKIFHGSTVCVEKPLATACRELLDFGKAYDTFDLIEGGIANDRVFDSIELYLAKKPSDDWLHTNPIISSALLASN